MKKILSPVLALMALGMASCADFLDLIPLNDIVAENYWTEKADLQSVLYSCYSQFETNDVMQRMFVWGEVRSDNVTNGSNTPQDLRHIVDENIQETNSWLNWQPFYQIINRCNTVIVNAPLVANIDPNYSESEMRANIAEATYLRTLAYFYLIRTFGAVPYTDKPSISDGDIDGDYRIAATSYEELIPQLISDLEAVRSDALRLYPIESSTGDAANTSRVTVCAFDALLADLYLWNKDYQKCVAACDRVFAYKLDRYEELRDEHPEEADRLELWHNKYPLLLEQPSGSNQGSAYNAIFGEGNSFESIFELYFQQNRSGQNELVSSFFGSSNTPAGQCGVVEQINQGIYDKTNKLFKPTDCRVPEFFEERGANQVCIRKYAYQTTSFSIDNKASNISRPSRPGTMRSQAYANWIIYRMTDVMLMKAEAEIEINTDASLDDAFQLIGTVYNRANNFVSASADTLKRDEYASQNLLRTLVLDERRRELMFEGKRWFDLVRFALRHPENNQGITYLTEQVKQKQKERVSVIVTQFKKNGAIFWPIREAELDANPMLHQNEAYIKTENSQK